MCHSFSFSPSNFSLFLISFTIYLFFHHPLYFCQKQSVDFPVDCPALPQSQTWRQVWREGGKQTERGWNAHKKRGQKRRLRALMIRNPFWRSVISVPSGAPQWADSTAELHSITCSRSPVCLSPPLSQPTQRAALSSATISPLLTRLFTRTPEENVHLTFWHHVPQSSQQAGETSKVHSIICACPLLPRDRM